MVEQRTLELTIGYTKMGQNRSNFGQKLTKKVMKIDRRLDISTKGGVTVQLMLGQWKARPGQ